MNNKLAENIRAFRKEKGLTQEQLAEVFGVTVGAVHKWEAGMSTPDISLIMDIADFFDTSMDVLTGFEVRDNSAKVLAKRLRRMTDSMDPNGPAEAEKALKKYPNSFSIVYECAYLYRAFGSMFKINLDYNMRAKDLYEQALKLVSQNTDPGIDETALYGQLALVYLCMGDIDKSIELYKAHNAFGIYNNDLAYLMTMKGEYEEADIYFSYEFLGQIGKRINLIIHRAHYYILNNDLDQARAIIELGMNEIKQLRKSEKSMFLDRIDCIYHVGMAYVELMSKNENESTALLKKAKKIAERFDKNPDFDSRNIPFVSLNEKLVAYDTSGETGIEIIENTIKELKSPKLEKIWKSVQKGGSPNERQNERNKEKQKAERKE